MSLIAKVPARDLYSAIFSISRGRRDPWGGSPIIVDGPLIFQGEENGWEGRDALVVASEITDQFDVIIKDTDIICDGTLYYPRARDIFSFIAGKQLLEQAVTLNIQGIFLEAENPAIQLPLTGSGFNSFVELDQNGTFLRDAWRIISLRNRIVEIDQINNDDPPVSRVEEVERYERDAVLVRLLKKLRGNKCQICGYTFRKRDGEYYSECHHLDSLGNGGFDISRNMLIVCANCHKRMHYAKVSIVEHKESRIIIDIDGEIYECRL